MFLPARPALKCEHVHTCLASPETAGDCRSLAQTAGRARPSRLQHLPSGAVWNDDEARDRVRDFVTRHLGESGVLIFDETGDLKKGTCTTAADRQYIGTARRIENAAVAVYATHATALGHDLVGTYQSFLDNPLSMKSVGLVSRSSQARYVPVSWWTDSPRPSSFRSTRSAAYRRHRGRGIPRCRCRATCRLRHRRR
jgi:DDE superfamily endonuclease